ncbi:MAG: hypothetical protein WAV10_02375, partial [Minisyncoccia bacterium]
MSYLLDKKIKRNNFLKIGLGIFVLLILIYFRAGIFNGLSYTTNTVFKSILVFGNNVGDKLSNAGSFFSSKKSLLEENENLKTQLTDASTKMLNYNSVLDENIKIKEIMGRMKAGQMTLAGILSKPNQ